MTNGVGWYSGNASFDSDPPSSVTLADDTLFSDFNDNSASSFNPIARSFYARIRGLTGGESVSWNAVWTPVVSDPSPATEYPLSPDQSAIRIFNVGHVSGVMILTATINGVEFSPSLRFTVSQTDDFYDAVVWDRIVVPPTPIPPPPAPPVPVGIQTLLERPDETGYAVSENQDSILNADLDGGPPRTRRDVIGGGRIVTVQWSGQAKRWQSIRNFFIQNVALNCPQFYLGLIIASSEYESYLCNLIPGSIKTSTPVGQYWVIQATLEVAPLSSELSGWPSDGNSLVLFDDNFTGIPGSIINRIPIVPTDSLWNSFGTGELDGAGFLTGDAYCNLVTPGAYPENSKLTLNLKLKCAVEDYLQPYSYFEFTDSFCLVHSSDGASLIIGSDGWISDSVDITGLKEVDLTIELQVTSYSITVNGSVRVSAGTYLTTPPNIAAKPVSNVTLAPWEPTNPLPSFDSITITAN